GAFDNTYLSGSGSTGFLYLCGSSAASLPTLQRVGFNNTATTFANKTGTMNATVDTVVLPGASASVECSPLTEFFNSNAAPASQDQLFFSVTDHGVGTNCSTTVGCVMAVNITGAPTTLSIAASIFEVGGSSGIIVDNSANSTTFKQAS